MDELQFGKQLNAYQFKLNNTLRLIVELWEEMVVEAEANPAEYEALGLNKIKAKLKPPINGIKEYLAKS